MYYGETKNVRNLRKPFNSETERIGYLKLSYIINKEIWPVERWLPVLLIGLFLFHQISLFSYYNVPDTILAQEYCSEKTEKPVILNWL